MLKKIRSKPCGGMAKPNTHGRVRKKLSRNNLYRLLTILFLQKEMILVCCTDTYIFSILEDYSRYFLEFMLFHRMFLWQH